jgi:hypothetical protein
VSGLEGLLRTRIDGDVLRHALLDLVERTATVYSGTLTEGIMLSALRVRRATGARNRSALARNASAVDRSSASQEPTYSERTRFLPDRPPDQFVKWAESERRLGRIITQPAAQDAMAEIFGPPPRGPSGRAVIAWCRSLPAQWTAKRGEPPSRAKRSIS